jgi:hypothetical protein
MEIKAEHMVEEGLRDRSGFILGNNSTCVQLLIFLL